MNRCSLGFLKKKILRSATDAAIPFRVMTSSDEDSQQLTPVGAVASLPAAKLGLGKEKAGLEATKSPGSNRSSPQEVIQHFKPQAGVKTVATATRLPDKIMAILLSEEAPDAIWWLQKGTAFAMQKEKFQTQILDKHFRGNKFKSLVRNLHRWGFKRMTCDTTPAGKTIAFSHKYFRQDKPELVQLIQITKEKDIGEATRERREALRAALPSTTSPPSALRLPGAPAGSLREEGVRVGQETGGLFTAGSASLPRQQQPSLANLVAAEHNQNLSAQGPDSLLHSLTAELKRTNQEATRNPLQSGLSLAGRPQVDLSGGLNADLLTRMAMRGAERDQLEQMRPSAQRLGSLLHPDGESLENALHSASFQQQRRDALIQQHLATAGLGSQADAHSRLFLQQQLANRSLVGGAPAPGPTSASLFHAPAPALLPHSQLNPQLLSQRVGNSGTGAGLQQGGWNIEELLARRNIGALQQQGSGRSMDGLQRSSQQDGATLTTDELRYLAELRRRGS